MTIDVARDGPFVTVTAYYRGAPAGRAAFTLEETHAELGDVVVYERALHWWPPARWLRIKCSYRRLGVGTSMMRAALQYLGRIGVREVRGALAGGDPGVQRAWYASLGFDVGPEGLVLMQL